VEDGSVSLGPNLSERRRRGAYFTPPALVDVLIRDVLYPALDGRSTPPRVIDPACGDGRLLQAAGEQIARHFGVDPSPFLVGVEMDPDEATRTAARLGVCVLVGDARNLLDTPSHSGAYDIVLGNPPYLSQLRSATSRGGTSTFGGGPYADAAAEFLALALRLVPEHGGRIGLVLPMSVLATRHVGPIRHEVERRAAITSFWWSDSRMFDASVRTCILGLSTGAATELVRRSYGPDATPIDSVQSRSVGAANGDSWSWLVADASGVPDLSAIRTAGVLADCAVATADFRDQYYGLVGAVVDDTAELADHPQLITSGLIDPGATAWGQRPTVFAKQRYRAPRVRTELLDERMRRWAGARLVPKVLVASQTRVIEAAVDEHGRWLPSVPVVSVVPLSVDSLWRVGALLTSPVASALLASQRLGSGLSPQALRVTARDLGALPCPAQHDDWDHAATALRAGDVLECGRTMVRAYGLDAEHPALAWWERRISATRGRSGSPNPRRP